MATRNRRRRPKYPQPPVYPFTQPVYAIPEPAGEVSPRTSAQTLQDKNASVAQVQVSRTSDWTKGPDYQFEASGSTKREQGDRFDPVTGELLALGRAFQKLGRDMISEGNKRVTALVREQREAAEAQAKPRKQVRHRSLDEWRAIQRKRQQEKNAQLASSLGLTPDYAHGNFSTVTSNPEMAADVQDILARWNTPLPEDGGDAIEELRGLRNDLDRLLAFLGTAR